MSELVCGCLRRFEVVIKMVLLQQRRSSSPDSSPSASYSSIRRSNHKAASCDIAKGFFPVYVGATRQRFVVPLSYLSHASIKLLLQECEEEYGFEQNGGLQLPCEVALFELAMQQAQDSFTAQQQKKKKPTKRSTRTSRMEKRFFPLVA